MVYDGRCSHQPEGSTGNECLSAADFHTIARKRFLASNQTEREERLKSYAGQRSEVRPLPGQGDGDGVRRDSGRDRAPMCPHLVEWDSWFLE